jgi:hypothetical protein
MKIIDQDGNLFGIINIIDTFILLIILIIITSGISFVITSSGSTGGGPADSEQVTNTQTSVIFRATGQPDYVTDEVTEASVSRSTIASIEEVSVVSTNNGNTLFLRLRLNVTEEPSGTTMWKGSRLTVGRSETISLPSIQIQDTITDTGDSAALPTPTPTPTPTPKEITQIISVQTTTPKYIANAITEGNVSASSDIIAVRHKIIEPNLQDENVTVELTIEAIVTRNQDQQLMYRGSRLFIGRDLRLDLGRTIITVTVTDLRKSE